MKKKNLSILKSSLLILPLATLAIFPIFINSIGNLNNLFNNREQTLVNENQEMNFETKMTLSKLEGSAIGNSQNLLNVEDDFIKGNYFEFDLNKFKPWGMDIDLFLKETKISFSGPNTRY